MTNDTSYVLDFVDGEKPTVAVEVPFLLKSPFQTDEDFSDVVARDFGIIKQFACRFSAKSGANWQSILEILDQAKIERNSAAAFVRAFFVHPDKKALVTTCQILFEECLGNLPGNFKKGGISFENPQLMLVEPYKESAPKQPEKWSKEFIEECVPTSQNFEKWLDEKF